MIDGLENRWQVHTDFLHAATWHQRNPALAYVDPVLCRIGLATDRRKRQFSERMPDEGRIYPPIAVKLLLKRKYHQRLSDVLAEKPHAPLAPRPELRCHVINHRNPALFHLSCDAPIEGRGIDDDRHVGLAAIGFCDEVVK